MVEDFEATASGLTYPLSRLSWYHASPPGGVESNASTYIKSQDYRHQGEFIWHSNNTELYKNIYPAVGNSDVDNQHLTVLKMTLRANDNLSGNSWGGIMRPNSSYYQDLSDMKYIEVVARGNVGSIYLDLGLISEDLSISGDAPNGFYDGENDLGTTTALHDRGLDNKTGSEEERIESKLDQEIQDRIDDVDAEENRAKAAEQVLTTNLANEITRATQTEQGLNHRIDVLNDELDAEESTRESNDAALSLRITTESNDRIAAINAEKARAEAAERTLNLKIEAESERAIQKEIELDERIDEIISGSPIEQLDELIEKLGYKDNDTLQTTNEHEVAFGEWNVSNTSTEPSGQTVFSVGIGTSAHDRKNALEVRKDGSVWATVEGEYLDITKILGQLTHEVYDADANGNH